jgi:hypothetical protein
MNEELFESDLSEPGRWRPATGLFRPARPPRIKARRSLPGQKFLPGLEREEDHGPPPQTVAQGKGRPIDVGHTAGKAGSPPACPNCGATEFDEDGDCAACLEPGVIEVDQQDVCGESG